MPRVVVERVMQGGSIDRVWAIAKKLTDYPVFMDQVLSVEPFDLDPSLSATSWVVLLNGNELRWVETDHYDEARRRVTFNQVEGDLAEWSGFFEAVFEKEAVLARYDVSFELGIPALADVLHPLGEVSIRANCQQMLEELERRSTVAVELHG